MFFSRSWNIKDCVKRCAENDRRAQERLYRHFFDEMYKLCRSHARDEDEALLILNNGFLKVFKNIHTFRFEGSLEGWIRKIIYHAISDYFRKNKRPVIYPILENHDRPVEKNALDTLYYEDLMEMITALPNASKKVFELYAIEGYTHREVGEKLGISEGTSKWHLSNARKKLKKLIRNSEKNVVHAG